MDSSKQIPDLIDFSKSSLFDNILVSMVEEYGLLDHQLNQINEFYTTGIYEIFDVSVPIVITSKPIEAEGSLYDSIKCEIFFHDVIMETPTMVDVTKDSVEPMFPTETLAKRQTYATNIRADIKFIFSAIKDNKVVNTFEKILPNRGICTMPVVVGSNKCNTYGLSDDALRKRGEDPNNVGGYYIVKGQEYYINTTESSAHNTIKIFRGNKSDNYLAKAEFTSKKGHKNESSFRIITMLGDDNIVYVIMYCGIFRDGIRIPLPTFISALGLVQPFSETISRISYKQPSIMNVCQACWDNVSLGYSEKDLKKYGRVRAARVAIAKLVKENSKATFPLSIGVPDEDNPAFVDWVSKELIRNFENCCFTVLNSTKDASLEKLNYLYRMVYWTIAAGIDPSDGLIDNRDISIVKRFTSPVSTIAKVTKSTYKHNVVASFRSIIKGAMNTTRFDRIDPEKLFKNEQKDISTEFQKSITQSINAGGNILNKDGNAVMKSQMKIGMAQYKNRLCIVSQARTVEGNSFGDGAVTTSSRNKEFRRNEQSLTGGICPVHSATESTSVGTKKQLAVSARITQGESDESIIEKLHENAELLNLDFKDPSYCDPLLQTIINVNGLAIAKTKVGTLDDFEIIRLFNTYKREGEIPRMTSVTYHDKRNEINFFTESGRIVRPVIPIIRTKNGKIVPGGTPDCSERIEITEEDLRECNFSKLLKEGKIIYLSLDEAPTYRVATSFEEWVHSVGSPVDHFDFIEIPSGIYSLAVITKPFFRYDQIARSVYQSSQSRQTGGKNVENIYRRFDKEMNTQFHTGKASVCTLFRELGMEEHGENVNLAVMQTTSDNQEDSIIVKKGSIDCGMFSMVKYDSRKIPVDSKEILGISESAKLNAMSGSDDNIFRFIDEKTGVAMINTEIGADPVVVVAKSIHVAESRDGAYTPDTKDKSYSTNNKYELEYVDHFNKCEIDKVTHVQISTVKSRNPEIGDKFSTRAGQKGIVGRICENNEMPYTINGDRPDIIINPHHQNTRRTIGMIYEGICALLASKLGIYIKGTSIPEPVFFSDPEDIDVWAKEELAPQYANYRPEDARRYIASTVASIKELRKQLSENNWDANTMINGLTGEVIQGEVVMVRIYYQRLLKVVKDAFYVASDSVSHDIHFLQPAAGSKNNGGLKMGEMETGTCVAHGGAHALGEKTHAHSDGIILQLCRCGQYSNYNYETKTSYCHVCKEKTDPIAIQTTNATFIMSAKMAGTGIGLNFIPEPYYLWNKIVTNTFTV